MVRTLGFQPGRQGSIPCRAAAVPCEVTQLAECSVVTREVGGSIPPFAAKTTLSWRNWQTQQVQTLWLRLVGSTPTESTPFASLTNRVLSLRARTSKHGQRTTSASKKTTKIGHRRRLVAGSSENNGSLSDRNPTCAGGADEVSTVTSSLVPVRQGGAWLCGIWNWPRLVGIPKSYLPLFCRRTSPTFAELNMVATRASLPSAMPWRDKPRDGDGTGFETRRASQPYEFDPHSLRNGKLRAQRATWVESEANGFDPRSLLNGKL